MPLAPVIHHYVFFELDRKRIHDASFLSCKGLEGAQLKYTWPELEPTEGHYDFTAIRKDLTFLKSNGKKLFVQLQDSTFQPDLVYVPKYLLTDPRFHGGASQQYDIPGDDDTKAKPAGWVSRRWDPAVQERFGKLLAALGRRFDGKIAGINLPETAIEFGTSGKLFPPGFTPDLYCKTVTFNLATLKRAFPKSVTMQYANFMPGEWLPEDNKHYLETVYKSAEELKVGLGGPDLQPGHPPQMHHSYPLIRAAYGHTTNGIAVQDGNYDLIDPKTKTPRTIGALISYAEDYLHVKFMFWCTEEPYYSQQLIPWLNHKS